MFLSLSLWIDTISTDEKFHIHEHIVFQTFASHLDSWCNIWCNWILFQCGDSNIGSLGCYIYLTLNISLKNLMFVLFWLEHMFYFAIFFTTFLTETTIIFYPTACISLFHCTNAQMPYCWKFSGISTYAQQKITCSVQGKWICLMHYGYIKCSTAACIITMNQTGHGYW